MDGSMNIYDMIKEHMAKSVPFAGFIGVELKEVSGERGVAFLPKRGEVENHIQTMHAGAMFTLGEAASGAALGGLLADQMLSVRPVAANATIKYVRTAKTDLTAVAKATITQAEALDRLEADGKIQFDVEVDLLDTDETVCAQMVVAWHVKKTG